MIVVFSSFFLFSKKLPIVVVREVCPSVRLSVRLSVRTIIVLLGGQLLVGPSLKWLATLKWLTT